MNSHKGVSLIIPVRNEAGNVIPLQNKIISAFKLIELDFEIIWVNDASSDLTFDELRSFDSELTTVITNRSCVGQSQSIYEGFKKSKFNIVAVIDGDGQNDPKDLIPMINLINKNNEVDFVQGKRLHRQDNFVTRIALSKVANWLTRRLVKIEIADLGCGSKVFRRGVIETIPLRGEMHRLYAAHAAVHMFHVVEMEVSHFPRLHGESKYGLSRIFKFFFDLFFVKFHFQIQNRPVYLFGKIAASFGFVGSILISFSLLMKLTGMKSYVDASLVIGGLIMFALGVISLFQGLIADLIVRNTANRDQ